VGLGDKVTCSLYDGVAVIVRVRGRLATLVWDDLTTNHVDMAHVRRHRSPSGIGPLEFCLREQGDIDRMLADIGARARGLLHELPAGGFARAAVTLQTVSRDDAGDPPPTPPGHTPTALPRVELAVPPETSLALSVCEVPQGGVEGEAWSPPRADLSQIDSPAVSLRPMSADAACSSAALASQEFPERVRFRSGWLEHF